MSEIWLVDGWNLIHAIRKQYKNLELLAVRDLVLKSLADFPGEMPDSTIHVVFDGKGSDDEFIAYKTKSLKVVYSQSVTADIYLSRFLKNNSPGLKTVVISDDRLIRFSAMSAGARIFSAKDFWGIVGQKIRESGADISRRNFKSHGFNRPFDKGLGEKGL